MELGHLIHQFYEVRWVVRTWYQVCCNYSCKQLSIIAEQFCIGVVDFLFCLSLWSHKPIVKKNYELQMVNTVFSVNCKCWQANIISQGLGRSMVKWYLDSCCNFLSFTPHPQKKTYQSQGKQSTSAFQHWAVNPHVICVRMLPECHKVANIIQRQPAEQRLETSSC